MRCPVNINTGEFTKQLRTAAIEGLDPGAGAASASTSSSWGSSLSLFAANNFKLISRGAPALLNTVDFFHGLLGPRVLEVVSGTLNKWTNHLVPQWNPYIPKVRPNMPCLNQWSSGSVLVSLCCSCAAGTAQLQVHPSCSMKPIGISDSANRVSTSMRCCCC